MCFHPLHWPFYSRQSTKAGLSRLRTRTWPPKTRRGATPFNALPLFGQLMLVASEIGSSGAATQARKLQLPLNHLSREQINLSIRIIHIVKATKAQTKHSNEAPRSSGMRNHVRNRNTEHTAHANHKTFPPHSPLWHRTWPFRKGTTPLPFHELCIRPPCFSFVFVEQVL